MFIYLKDADYTKHVENTSIIHSWESLGARVHHNSSSSLQSLYSWWFQVSNMTLGGLKRREPHKKPVLVFNLTPELKAGLVASPLIDAHKNYQCNFSLRWSWSMLQSLKGQVKYCPHTTPNTEDIDCHDHPHPPFSDVKNLGQHSVCRAQVLSACSCISFVLQRVD